MLSNPKTEKTYTEEARGRYADVVDCDHDYKILCCDQIYLKEYGEGELGVGMEIHAFVADSEVTKPELFEKMWYEFIIDKLPDMLMRLDASIND